MNLPASLRCVNGSVHVIDDSNPVIREHFAKDSSLLDTLFYQINETDIFRPLLNNSNTKNLVVLDLGANIGLWSIYAAAASSRILAIEPSPNTFKVLKEMVSQFPNIEVAQLALAPRDGNCFFYENDVNTTCNSTVNTYGTMTMVEGIKLSSILKRFKLNHVDVCKIDVEGAEELSLLLADLQAVDGLIDSFHIEVHNTPDTSWNAIMGRIIRDLTTVGFIDIHIRGTEIIAWPKPKKAAS